MKNLFYFDWRTSWTMIRLVRVVQELPGVDAPQLQVHVGHRVHLAGVSPVGQLILQLGNRLRQVGVTELHQVGDIIDTQILPAAGVGAG